MSSRLSRLLERQDYEEQVRRDTLASVQRPRTPPRYFPREPYRRPPPDKLKEKGVHFYELQRRFYAIHGLPPVVYEYPTCNCNVIRHYIIDKDSTLTQVCQECMLEHFRQRKHRNGWIRSTVEMKLLKRKNPLPSMRIPGTLHWITFQTDDRKSAKLFQIAFQRAAEEYRHIFPNRDINSLPYAFNKFETCYDDYDIY